MPKKESNLKKIKQPQDFIKKEGYYDELKY